MPARILDGVAIAAAMRADVAERVAAHQARGGREPHLAVLLASDRPADRTFAEHKQRDGAGVGIEVSLHDLPASATTAALVAEVERLNSDPAVNGILVQTPLPPQVDTLAVMRAIEPGKDIDGLSPQNLGLLLQGNARFVPAGAVAIRELLVRSSIETKGAHVVIVGRSPLFALPLATLLLDRDGANATVTITDPDAPDFTSISCSADILVSAMNHPGTITAEHVRPGAGVIDAALNVIDDPTRPRGSRLVGDVDTEAVREVAGILSPVPGGTGPITIAVLLAHTLEAARRAD